MSTAKERLAALSSFFAEKTNPKAKSSSPIWKKFYAFWKMQPGETATVRFLPDRDADNNPYKFLVENLTHDLVINGQKKKVPCLTMYGESCPICELSKKYYDEEGDESAMGKKYYKKRSYIGQVLVIESPFDHTEGDEADASLVKLIDFGPKVFKCINTGFESGDLEDEPYNFKGGHNFRIKKTQAGKFADYGTSSFSPKQTDIDDEVIDVIKSEMYNLSEFREKYVSREALEAMLLADRTGQAVNEAPASPSESSSQSASQKSEVSQPVTESKSTESETQSTGETSNKAKSVLEQLRARAAAKKSETE